MLLKERTPSYRSHLPISLFLSPLLANNPPDEVWWNGAECANISPMTSLSLSYHTATSVTLPQKALGFLGVTSSQTDSCVPDHYLRATFFNSAADVFCKPLWPDSLTSCPKLYLLQLFSILQFICGQLPYPFPASCYWSFRQHRERDMRWDTGHN